MRKCTAENFCYFDSEKFFKILQKNIDLFTAQMAASDNISPERMVKIILTESIFKTIYLNGTRANTTLPANCVSIINEMIKPAECCVSLVENIPNVVQKIYDILNNSDRYSIVSKILRYSKNPTPHKKSLLDFIYEIYFNQKLLEEDKFIERLFKSYITEKTGSLESSVDILSQPVENTGKTVFVDKALKKIFIQSNLSTVTKLSKVLFSIFQEKLELSNDEALLRIKNYMISNEINSVFTTVSAKSAERSLILFEQQSQRRVISTEHDQHKLDFLNSIPEVESKLETTTSEMIRLFQGLFYHSESSARIVDLSKNLVYAFNNIRNIDWFRNRINNLDSRRLEILLNEELFHEFIDAVKNWKPVDFLISQRLEYMNQHGIVLTHEQDNIYLQLLEYDIEKWNESSIRDRLRDATPFEIFYTVVQAIPKYQNIRFKTKIQRWSDSYVLVNGSQLDDIAPSNDDNYNPPEIEFGFDNDIEHNIRVDNPVVENTPVVVDSKSVIVENPVVVEVDKPLIVKVEKPVIVDDKPLIVEIEKLVIVESENPVVVEIDNHPVFETNDNPVLFEIDNHPVFDIDDLGDDNSNVIVDSSNALSNNCIFNEFQEREYIDKLFSTYRFGEFTASLSLKRCFYNIRKPTTVYWNNFLRNLTSRNILSSTKVVNKVSYRFRIKGARNNPNMTYDHALSCLRKWYDNDQKPEFSAFLSKSKFTGSVVPDLNSWIQFIEYLVSTNILRFTRNYNNAKRYSF